VKGDQSIGAGDGGAAAYDRLTRECGWFGPEVLLGLAFEYLRPPGRLLDIGIGTGLGSGPFAHAGLEVYGFDASVEMLAICREKGIAVDLRQFDLREAQFPYQDRFFDVVIACGVFHFFRDLEPILQESARVTKQGGVLAFTVWAPDPQKGTALDGHAGVSESCSQGVTIFGHDHDYVRRLLESHGFVVLKHLRFLVQSGPAGDDLVFSAHVAHKGGGNL